MESLPGGNSSGTVGTALPEGASVDWKALEGQEFYGEYLAKTDPLGAQNVENPISHVAYGYATHVCVLNDDGTIREIDAAHFVGKAINPLSCEGQIEGGVTMALGFTLTEHYPLYDCIPSAAPSRCRPSTAFWRRRRGRTWPAAPSAAARSRPFRRLPPWRARTSRSTARCARAFR